MSIMSSLNLILGIVIIAIFVVDEERIEFKPQNNSSKNENETINIAVSSILNDEENINIYQEMMEIITNKNNIFNTNNSIINKSVNTKQDKIDIIYSSSIPIPIPQNKHSIKYAISFPPPIPDNKKNNYTFYY